jgi:hypothetical protein
MPYDPSTDAGKVRMLINDTDDADPTFNDVEIATFLSMESGSIKLAAAQALDTLADNEAMVSKVIRNQDMSTDGAKVADSLHNRAAALREQAYNEGDGVAFAFDIADYFDPDLIDPGAIIW